jgi:hypothetical protein
MRDIESKGRGSGRSPSRQSPPLCEGRQDAPLHLGGRAKPACSPIKPMNRVAPYRMRRRTAEDGFRVKLGSTCSVRPASRPISSPAARSNTPR